MKTKITNVIKAVCIASFCASALSQTIKETDPSASTNKKVDMFICNAHKGSYFWPNDAQHNVDISDCRNRNLNNTDAWAMGVCLSERVEISKLQEDGVLYRYSNIEQGDGFTNHYDMRISRENGYFTYSQTAKNNTTGNIISKLEKSGVCKLETRQLKF